MGNSSSFDVVSPNDYITLKNSLIVNSVCSFSLFSYFILERIVLIKPRFKIRHPLWVVEYGLSVAEYGIV